MGVQNLLTKLLPANTNWLLWNRNPDLFINRWENAHQHPERLTNSLREPCLDVIDLVIFAGTPEWTGQSVRRIYEELLRYPHVPVLMLGVGSGAANIDLSPIEIEVISRDNVTIITRAAELANAINALIEKPKAIAMPCPALFCNATETFPGNNNKIGFILQSSSVINQSISETSVQTILQFLGNYAEKSVDVVCFYIDEFMRFIRSLSNKSVIYDLNAAVYLKRLQQYSVVLSTRLHGAIASLSCGVPTILVCDDNYRIQSTAELFGGILPVMAKQTSLNQSNSTI
ncbi:MAG: polysaccharide pyruvyl transferase family protein [Coxiellaceae bacterium]|nr:MAG: polysaccharide pyruvyl transferase family protein [Coxiellaceae bacterium]